MKDKRIIGELEAEFAAAEDKEQYLMDQVEEIWGDTPMLREQERLKKIYKNRRINYDDI